MFQVLMNLCEKQKYACIYANLEERTKFIFGQITAVNEDEVAIRMLTPNGEEDGIVAKQVTDIIRLETDCRYAESMIKLSNTIKKQLKMYPLQQEHIFFSLLTFAQKNRRVVSIEILNSGLDDIVGFIEQCSEEICTVLQVDQYGREDGYSFVALSDITQISCDSEEERRTFILWQLETGGGAD